MHVQSVAGDLLWAIAKRSNKSLHFAARSNAPVTWCDGVLETVFAGADLSVSLRSVCSHEMMLPPFDSSQRRRLFHFHLQKLPTSWWPVPATTDATAVVQDMSRSLAARTAGLSYGELLHVLNDAIHVATLRAAAVVASTASTAMATSICADEDVDFASLYGDGEGDGAAISLRLCDGDVTTALANFQARSSSSAGTIAKIPNVTWDDVGGLGTVRRIALDPGKGNPVLLTVKYVCVFLCVTFQIDHSHCIRPRQRF